MWCSPFPRFPHLEISKGTPQTSTQSNIPFAFPYICAICKKLFFSICTGARSNFRFDFYVHLCERRFPLPLFRFSRVGLTRYAAAPPTRIGSASAAERAGSIVSFTRKPSNWTSAQNAAAPAAIQTAGSPPRPADTLAPAKDAAQANTHTHSGMYSSFTVPRTISAESAAKSATYTPSAASAPSATLFASYKEDSPPPWLSIPEDMARRAKKEQP